ncbi:DNA polymerase epsilon catalytic subunit A [Strongyloides ratti]|uniref:DNA polymerase epsilon catalytic subunit n=1 Tax=Strongyloides ratti TaxID=34506 RepID=A0A090L8K2_STRRB|nr:DNA polymerase epsilon catalytic subunit A [Strongyloides ratti]CEF64463.1 DNA polymerase epsilon catalytic subunit A [Strongyloides ratti]
MDGSAEVDNRENDKNYLQRKERIQFKNDTDAKYGYSIYTDSKPKIAWLVNVQSSELIDEHNKDIIACVDYYFLEESGERFKICYPFRPYFLLATVSGFECGVASFLEKKYVEFIKIEIIEKENLDLKNHLSGVKSKYLKLSFPSVTELQKVKKELMPVIEKNKKRIASETEYKSLLAKHLGNINTHEIGDAIDKIIEIREYDVPYHMRVSIDMKIFVGLWYTVVGRDENRLPSLKRNYDIIEPAEPVVLAFDIETTKMPLKFPDSEFDQIMMISYMIDGLGYLIINRTVVSADIHNFEYTPKPEYPGEFTVFNEEDEKALLIRFFDHIIVSRPSIIVTYNGDFFDWPFVDARARHYQLNMREIIGFSKDSQGEYKSDNCIHMDAFRWVQRDSYLPMGSQNLKACTKAKLGYEPVELDPELMVTMAIEKPQILANYSVSDAVATYYLYMKYVHPFIFALCTIIPLGGDDVLRKGSGTLCESLLMVEAFHNNIVFPNKLIDGDRKITSDNRVIESETYVGGRVEALESGVFRADIKTRFCIVPEALEMLKEQVRDTMKFALNVENGIDLENVINFDEVCKETEEKLDQLKNTPNLFEYPKVYHLDVGAMYPNIILTNRLQPPAIVSEEDCMACIYNTPDAKCKRDMNWVWRGELMPCTRTEYDRIIQQLETESFGKPPVPFHELPKEERMKLEKKRVQDFCRRAYGKNHVTRIETRTTRVCEREHGFFVDTVKAFRDRRYDYKEKLKKAKGELAKTPPDDLNGIRIGQSRVILYESLQMAHKCILNSFYGYAMRRGSRWFSMEMAGIVCHTGANIIQEARKLVEQIGRPLELDTDGIWCMLPSSLPENLTFKLQGLKKDKVTISYAGSMLNALVKDKFTNHQYHVTGQDGNCEIKSENSIFFEVDGPYLAMILPASKEEGKKLKKRYAVFNFDGSLSELKGFELKRRGELNMIKLFQENVFKLFLKGTTLEECYKYVAKEADYWLDVLYSKGVDMTDKQLFDLISENRSMSRKLSEYEGQKSTSITTARRMAQFLGDEMVRDAGLACKFIISQKPLDAPVAERAIPLAIFQTNRSTQARFLRQWTKDSAITEENVDIRNIIDWAYYIERVGNTMQKIITIPAALQGVPNPVPRLPHPEWLDNIKKEKQFQRNQPKITSIFKKIPNPVKDIEVIGSGVYFDKENEGNCNRKRGRSIVLNNDSKTVEDSPTNKKIKTINERKTIKKDGFIEWINYNKCRWREIRNNIAERKKNLSNNDSNSLVNRPLTTLEKMVLCSKNEFLKKNWEIVEISQTDTPGLFVVYAIVGNTMKKFNVNVPRIFYVNQYHPKNDVKHVKKILPRCKPLLNLYEYSIDETNFSSSLRDLYMQLCEKKIEGIYETQVPLDFRSMISIGAVAKIVSMRASNTNTYNMNELQILPSIEKNYLYDKELKKLFFYNYSSGNLHIVAFFSPTHNLGKIFVVHNRNLDIMGNKSIYKDELERFLKKHKEEYFDREAYSKLDIEIQQCRDVRNVALAMKNMYKQFGINESQLYILLVQSPNTRKYLTDTYPVLSYFPHVRIYVAEPSDLLTTLGWQNKIVSRICKNFLFSHVLLDELITQGRYLNIPIGNIKEDFATFAADIIYARCLNREGYLLWATTAPEPDLGGKDIQDYRVTNDWDSVSFRTHHSFIINKEAYKCGKIVVDINLGCLAVCALLQANKIAEAEGTNYSLGFASGVELAKDKIFGKEIWFSIMDEAAAANKSVEVLRQVVVECVKDINSDGAMLADEVISNIHRWLRSPRSLMYDPAISKAVTVLMKKLCFLLVTEITRVGGEVIHCSYTRLIISTEKDSIYTGTNFVRSMIDALSRNPLFSVLTFTVQNYWDIFSWIDPSNYAAMKVGDTSDDDELIFNWAMSSYFPDEASRAIFNNFIGGYMTMLGDFYRSNNKKNNKEFIKFKKEKILKDVCEKMCKLTERNIKKYRNAEIPDDLPPIYMAEEFTYNIPLEMVNCFIKILSLDSSIEEEIEIVRCKAMDLMKIDKYSEKSFWKPITYSCVLDHLICQHCNNHSEIDVCMIDTKNNGVGEFICSSCKKAFDKNILEQMLLQRAHKMIIAYSMQDLQCVKCKEIRNNNFSSKCGCSNKYEFINKRSEIMSNLRILYCVAITNNFNFLKDIVESCLDL